MPRIHLIRHGQAAAGFGDEPDPGLNDVGREQAATMAAHMAGNGPLALISSPLQRACETAKPLAHSWGTTPAIEPRVTEIPSPTENLDERAAWLRGVMDKRWDELGDSLADWRQGILDALDALTEDTVIVTHFMVINIAIGAALNDPRLVIYWPDNCSIWEIETSAAGLRLVAEGKQLETKIG